MDWMTLEEKWRHKWEEDKYFEADPNNNKKFFVTVAYPYPNSPQHVGHGRTYTLADVHARFMRMLGYNVLFPMGFHYTGTPILGMARRVQDNDIKLLETFRTLYRVPDDKIKEFTEPVKIADYFHQEIKTGMIEMGYSIDWRREFTTIDPVYSKFIEWQFGKLKEKNLIIQGTHPVGWCPKDQNPVSQHDTQGDVEPSFTEYTIIKFRYDKYIIPTATLRPETIFGVTNIWINPEFMYEIVQVDNETWIVTSECARKLEFHNKTITRLDKILGKELVGKKVQVPERDEQILILPASFVKSENGTGIVMSVPAHAPFDYQALEDLKKESIKYPNIPDLQSIKAIPIIETKDYGQIPALDVITKFQIENQNSSKLEEATKEIYSKEFYGGRLKQNTGRFVNKTVAEAKEEVKKWMLQEKNADVLYELNEIPIRCRCGAECVVKILSNQWFLNYSDPEWKTKVHAWINEMKILPEEIRNEFNNVVDWLRERACARQHGLGTKLPWDKNWIIESLSDSVIYMAYYTIAKYVNNGEITPENVSDAFFDYIFLNKGNSENVSSQCKISLDLLYKIKKEFQYFYPVNARHSGRDLVPNHLTFFIFNHIAIFPREYWPEEIVVNGSVLMDGKKMSKSEGNIIPLRDAIRNHGADSIRLTILISAELLQDADFNQEAVKGIKNKLENMLEECSKYRSSSYDAKLEQEDKWIKSKTEQLIIKTTSSIQKMRLREALHFILYEFESDLQWYMKRALAKKRDNFVGILHDIFSTRISMMSPFAPYASEEMWSRLGNTGIVSKSSWPTYHENMIDFESIQSENLLKNTIEDIKNIIKVTKITPNKITIYTSAQWKVKAYQKILASIVAGEVNIGSLIRSLIADKETEEIKKDPDFVKKTVNDILSESQEERESKNKLGLVDEKKILVELDSLVQAEFGITSQVFSESDQDKYDPKNKSRTARPYKPAILIE
ncbi:MAG: leucine--tRNA ligase [Thaumarchaeota archaeon]|nr:leucine--tRNA ligase [Nitrososphaerota archaeon]MDE1818274.1 leucine--tRNA ligase [Nitrososphaerota archaeon]MDE1876494.1 leucine--tRNA ligase [Nitrososphaerota archaeon]